MTTMEPVAIAVDDGRKGYIQWTPAVAGALAAAALAFVLHSFAAAIGIAAGSAAPTWRDSSFVLISLSGLYLVFVAIVAFGVGGYIAGRMRAPVAASADEIEFRDGTHGLLVWAIALIITVLMTWATAQSLARVGSASTGSAAQSVAGEGIIAYDLDRLFRAEKRPQNLDMTYPRSEAARILLTAAGHSGLATDDRTYLVRLTAANTGLAAPEAEKRVDTIVAQARDNVSKARRAAVILAFMAGAAALLGAAVAWFAACAGGHHRDDLTTAPSMTTWGWSGPRAVR